MKSTTPIFIVSRPYQRVSGVYSPLSCRGQPSYLKPFS